MNNFLVTGCAGFIGSHMVDILIENNHNVVGVDKFTYASNIDNIKHHLKNGCMASDTFKIYPFDICDHKDIEHIFNHNDILFNLINLNNPIPKYLIPILPI